MWFLCTCTNASLCWIVLCKDCMHGFPSMHVYMLGSKAHMHNMMLFLMYGAKEFMHGKGSRQHVMHTVHMSFYDILWFSMHAWYLAMSIVHELVLWDVFAHAATSLENTTHMHVECKDIHVKKKGVGLGILAWKWPSFWRSLHVSKVMNDKFGYTQVSRYVYTYN